MQQTSARGLVQDVSFEDLLAAGKPNALNDLERAVPTTSAISHQDPTAPDRRYDRLFRRPFEPLPHRPAYALPQPLIPSQLARPLLPVELRW